MVSFFCMITIATIDGVSPDVVAIGGPYLAAKRLSREGADLTVRPVGSLPWQTMPKTNLSSLAVLLSDRN